MREVKRKRPWETQQEETEPGPLNTFLYQLILCTFITIGIFTLIHTDNNTHIKHVISRELSKNIQIKDVQYLMDYIGETFSNFKD